MQTKFNEGDIGSVDKFEVFGVKSFPEINPGTNLSDAIIEGFRETGGLKNYDVVVVASKVVSKSENMYLGLDNIVPSEEAVNLSNITGKPEKVCQVVINESQKVWTNGKALLAYHKQGFLLSSAGVDRISDDLVILLPRDPDGSAKKISQDIEEKTGTKVAVIISDSHGKEDRDGAASVALGLYGISPMRVTSSVVGNKTKIAEETLCDMFTDAASIIMGQRGRGVPAVCIRGIPYEFKDDATVKSIVFLAPNKLNL